MTIFAAPTGQPAGERWSPPWRAWFLSAGNVVQAAYSSGTTASRPTEPLWIGRFYFDTTLGIPIWYDGNIGTGWCDATGAAV